jgi:hypothetical protein
MQKKLFAMAIVLGLSITLSGCLKSPAEKVSEKIIEKNIEAQTGGKVDIDSDEGKMSFTDENGTTNISTGSDVDLPDGFPKEFIIAKDAKITAASNIGGLQSVVYESDEDKKELNDALITKLTKDGWKKTLEMDADISLMVNFEKGGKRASFMIGDNESEEARGKTIVSVTLGEN